MITRSEASRLQQSSSRGANGDDTDTEISHSHFSWDILYTKLNTHEEVLTLSFSTYPLLLCTMLNTHEQVLTLSFSVPNSARAKRYLPFPSLYQTQHTQRGTHPFILCTKLNTRKEVLTLSFAVPNSTHAKGYLPFHSLCRTQHVKRYFIPITSLLTCSFCVLNLYTQSGNYTHSFSVPNSTHTKRYLPIHSLCRTCILCAFSVPNSTHTKMYLPIYSLYQTQHTRLGIITYSLYQIQHSCQFLFT